VIANNIQNQIKSNHNKKSINNYNNDKSKKEKSCLLGLREDGGKNLRERINREGEGRLNQTQQQETRKKQLQRSNKKQIGMKKKKERRRRRIRRREEATDNREEEGKEREEKGREEGNRRQRRNFFNNINAITKYNKQIYINQNFIKETQKH
jgi:hypothetical protein